MHIGGANRVASHQEFVMSHVNRYYFIRKHYGNAAVHVFRLIMSVGAFAASAEIHRRVARQSGPPAGSRTQGHGLLEDRAAGRRGPSRGPSRGATARDGVQIPIFPARCSEVKPGRGCRFDAAPPFRSLSGSGSADLKSGLQIDPRGMGTDIGKLIVRGPSPTVAKGSPTHGSASISSSAINATSERPKSSRPTANRRNP